MKSFRFTALIGLALLTFASCKRGDYDNNPSSDANNSVNPLSPLNSTQLSSFATSSAPSVISASVNGSAWTSGNSTTTWRLDNTGTNIMTGYTPAGTLVLYLRNVYGGNIYNMGQNNMVTYGVWTAPGAGAGSPIANWYSYLGNSGEVQILENDPVYIRGTFYFQGINSEGNVVNVNSGYFYIRKP